MIELETEATFGCKFKKNDLVKKGQVIGIGKDLKTKIKSPVNGHIKNIVFKSDTHSFLIEI